MLSLSNRNVSTEVRKLQRELDDANQKLAAKVERGCAVVEQPQRVNGASP